MTSQASYSTILRSSAIIGGAQFTNILIGLVRIKMVALLLGPAGIGLLGFYTNLIQIAATVSGLGINTTGTRQIAAANAKGGTDAISLSRRALFWGSLALALTGGAIFWLASGWIARVVLADAGRSSEVAWLALGVTLTVAASSQSALLTGLRRVGDLARVNVGAGIISTVLSVLALWALGDKALVLVALLGPGVGFVLGHVYVARLAKPSGPATSLTTMAPEWREMVALGLPFMLSGLVMTLGQLLVRTILQRELGLGAAGYFQAAWAIGMMYLGFFLGAMGTDYYPRLAALIRDAREAKLDEADPERQDGAFERGLARLVHVENPASPCEAVVLDVVEPHRSAARPVVAFHDVVDLFATCFARLVGFDPAALVLDIAPHLGEVPVVGRIDAQPVHVDGVLRVNQAKDEVRASDPSRRLPAGHVALSRFGAIRPPGIAFACGPLVVPGVPKRLRFMPALRLSARICGHAA